MPPLCAFLSTDDLDGFFAYDSLAIPCFEALGWAVEEVSWREDDRAAGRDGVDWSRYRVVVIRTPWDYQDAPDAFLEVLGRIAAATRLENSLALCRWNLEKTYLRDLERRGVAVVPTVWRSADEGLGEEVFELLADRGEVGVEEIVVKPVVGANADRTHRLPRAEVAARGTRWALARAELAGRAAMVQPFLPEVVDEGEYSLFAFDGRLSHAVLKVPAPGDFRVQEEHGGRIRSVTPEPALVTAGETVLDALRARGETPLYARADFVRHRGEFLLMELELIEPSLYFPYDPESPRRFAEATVRREARELGAWN